MPCRATAKQYGRSQSNKFRAALPSVYERFYFAFPDCHDREAHALQCFLFRSIPCLIGCNLRDPELPIPLWNRGADACLMAVPETPVDEDCPPPRAIRYVRCAGKTTIVDAETIALAP